MFLSKLSATAFDAVGRHNPQLLREWQGRLRWRNLFLALALSLLVQGLVVLNHVSRLPSATSKYSRYCMEALNTNLGSSECIVGPEGTLLVDWVHFWASVFRDLSYVLVWAFIIIGVYLLAADLAKEMRRGTLNFLRLSPLPARQLLLGKLLGVPVLLYVGVASLLPAHVATGLMGTYTAASLLKFYGLLGAIAFCLFSAAMWAALLTSKLQGLQSWLVAGGSALLLLAGAISRRAGDVLDWIRLFNPLHILADWQIVRPGTHALWAFDQGAQINGFRKLRWFTLLVGNNVNEYWLLACGNAVLLGLCFWLLLERKYKMPALSAMGKRQSYGLTLGLALMLMGFSIQRVPTTQEPVYLFDAMLGYAVLMLAYSVGLVFLLLPSKQSLLDWARFRHFQGPATGERTRRERPRDQRKQRVVRDLLFSERSPAAGAIALNWAIASAVLLLGASLTQSLGPAREADKLVFTWFVYAAILVICALVAQLIVLADFIHWRWINAGAIAGITLGIPITLGIAGIHSAHAGWRMLWLLTFFPHEVAHRVSFLELGIAIATHLSILTGLSFWLARRINVLGQSEWKALMSANTRQT